MESKQNKNYLIGVELLRETLRETPCNSVVNGFYISY
jgi:hypothetical protein